MNLTCFNLYFHYNVYYKLVIYFLRRVIKIRIFTAIDFDTNTKSYFQNINDKLKINCIKGRFTHMENFHLTLQFIGEIDKSYVPKVIDIMKECVTNHESFNITLDKLGSFKRGNSNLMWVGINKNENLISIHKKLSFALKNGEIPFDEKALKPHITLGRDLILKRQLSEIIDLIPVDDLVIAINNITLMESKHVNGKLTYIPLAIFALDH